jgi:hypothetical protein
MGEEECAVLRIVKFTAIIALNALDGGAKLRANKSEEVRKSGFSVMVSKECTRESWGQDPP